MTNPRLPRVWDVVCRVEVKVRDLPPGQEVDEWYEVTPPHQQKSASDKFFQIVSLRFSCSASAQLATLEASYSPCVSSSLLTQLSCGAAAAFRAPARLPGLPAGQPDVDDSQGGAEGGGLHDPPPEHSPPPEGPPPVPPAPQGKIGGPGFLPCLQRLQQHKGGAKRQVRQACVLPTAAPPPPRTQMTYTPLRQEDVLKGGVLYVRVRGVDSLVGKPWVTGGWRQTVKVRRRCESLAEE